MLYLGAQRWPPAMATGTAGGVLPLPFRHDGTAGELRLCHRRAEPHDCLLGQAGTELARDTASTTRSCWTRARRRHLLQVDVLARKTHAEAEGLPRRQRARQLRPCALPHVPQPSQKLSSWQAARAQGARRYSHEAYHPGSSRQRCCCPRFPAAPPRTVKSMKPARKVTRARPPAPHHLPDPQHYGQRLRAGRGRRCGRHQRLRAVSRGGDEVEAERRLHRRPVARDDHRSAPGPCDRHPQEHPAGDRSTRSRSLASRCYLVDPHGLAGIFLLAPLAGHGAQSRAAGARRSCEGSDASPRRRRPQIAVSRASPSSRCFVPISYEPGIITIGRARSSATSSTPPAVTPSRPISPQEWPHVSMEAVIARAPQALLLMRGGHITLDGSCASSKPGWNTLPAVRDRRVLLHRQAHRLSQPGRDRRPSRTSPDNFIPSSPSGSSCPSPEQSSAPASNAHHNHNQQQGVREARCNSATTP